jgi:CHASE3 domain sensor protein
VPTQSGGLPTLLKSGRQVEHLFSEIQDAETGQRGFLLTADPTYFNPFNEAKRQIPATKDQLRLLTRDNAEHQTRLDKLYPLIDQKLAELERTVVLAQSADLAGAIAIVKTNAGRDLMTAIRAVISDFDAAEVRLKDAPVAKAAFQRSILLSLIFSSEQPLLSP